MITTFRNENARQENLKFITDEGKIVPFGVNVYDTISVDGAEAVPVASVEPEATYLIETWKSGAKFFVNDEFMAKSIASYDISTIKGVV